MGVNSDEKEMQDLHPEWLSILKKMSELREDLEKYSGKSREVSLAKTKMDEAFLWWHCERGMMKSLVFYLDELKS